MVTILSILLWSTQKQVDPRHVLALYFEYNTLAVSEFSLNMKRNLGNDAHLKLGPFFWAPLYGPCEAFKVRIFIGC